MVGILSYMGGWIVNFISSSLDWTSLLDYIPGRTANISAGTTTGFTSFVVCFECIRLEYRQEVGIVIRLSL